MKYGSVIWVIAIICAGAGGYWIGQQNHVPAPVLAVTTGNTDTNHAVQISASAPTGTTVDASPVSLEAGMPLADVTAGLLLLKGNGDFGLNNDPDQKWSKLLMAVNLPDIPQVLAFANS